MIKPSPVEAARVAAREAWAGYASAVAEAAAVFDASDLIRDDIDAADALGFLTRLTRHAAAAVDPGDTPIAPRFRPFGPPDTSFGIPNPDNLYQVCSIHPDHEYRITGKRNNVHFFSLGAQAPGRAARPGTPSHLGDDRLILDEDGSFTIAVSSERREGNWIQIQPDSRTLMVRQTYLRRATETAADLSIERIAGPAVRPSNPIESSLRRIARSTQMIKTLAAFWPDWVRSLTDHAAVNEFFIFDEATHLSIGGDPEVRIPLCRWIIDPDEALVIELRPPRCNFWNVQLATVWSEQMPARTGQSTRNNAQVEAASDGAFRLVVSPEDPGCPNWLDTGGRMHGVIAVRWVNADALPLPTTRVVALPDLREGRETR